MAGLGAAALLLLPVTGIGFLTSAFAALWFAALGWIVPTFYVGARVKRRQKEITRRCPTRSTCWWCASRPDSA